MDERHRVLLELQDLDFQVSKAEAAMAAFGPQLESLEAPLAALERELEDGRSRLTEMRQEVKRLERVGEEKRERYRRYQERLGQLRGQQEQAAARAELDLVRRAAEADDREARELADQITRVEIRQDELEKQLAKARQDVDPHRRELLERQGTAERELAVLRDRRENHAIRVDGQARQLYERVRGGRTRTALAPLTADGACGQCFTMVPIQQQVEIRQGRALYRCEGCGVILFAQD